MKVISRGFRRNYLLCKKCHSLLEYTEKDLEQKVNVPGNAYLICPVCDNYVSIKDDEQKIVMAITIDKFNHSGLL